MKATKKISLGLLALMLVLNLAACGGVDFKSGVIGEWVIYHFYERAENGTDVFLDETNYYTVTVVDDSFTVIAEDGSLVDIGGTYTWTKADEAEVIMNDGTHCTAQISENSKKHNENAVFDIYIVETNMYYVLEMPTGAE